MNEIFQKCTVWEQLKLRISLAVPQRFALELVVDLANQSNRIILFFEICPVAVPNSLPKLISIEISISICGAMQIQRIDLVLYASPSVSLSTPRYICPFGALTLVDYRTTLWTVWQFYYPMKKRKTKLACYTFWLTDLHTHTHTHTDTIHMRSTAKFVHGIVLNIHFHWDGSLFVYELAP